MKLSFVIVTHNVKNYIGNCIDSIHSALEDIRSMVDSSEIIVVDRASSDGTLNAGRVAGEFTALDIPYESGWAAAANLGAAKASGETIVFVAPEAEIQPGGLPRLLEYLDTNPACAIAGGSVVSQTGAILRGPSRFPGLRSKLAESTGIGARFPQTILAWGCYGGTCLELPRLVDAVSFSYAAVKTSSFRKLGCFDERFFSDFADTDLCRRASRAMLPRPTVAFVPQARARVADNFALRCETAALDLHGGNIVRDRVRCEALYVWKNYCILTSAANTALELVGQACRWVVSSLPVVGCAKSARHSKAVMCETVQAALDTQLGSQYPTTPW